MKWKNNSALEYKFKLNNKCHRSQIIGSLENMWDSQVLRTGNINIRKKGWMSRMNRILKMEHLSCEKPMTIFIIKWILNSLQEGHRHREWLKARGIETVLVQSSQPEGHKLEMSRVRVGGRWILGVHKISYSKRVRNGHPDMFSIKLYHCKSRIDHRHDESNSEHLHLEISPGHHHYARGNSSSYTSNHPTNPSLSLWCEIPAESAIRMDL